MKVKNTTHKPQVQAPLFAAPKERAFTCFLCSAVRVDHVCAGDWEFQRGLSRACGPNRACPVATGDAAESPATGRFGNRLCMRSSAVLHHLRNAAYSCVAFGVLSCDNAVRSGVEC